MRPRSEETRLLLQDGAAGGTPERRARARCPATFVLVCVQEVLELCVEDLQVLLDQDLLALPGQLVLGGFVEVHLHPPLLLQQTSLRLSTAGGKQRFSSGVLPQEPPPLSPSSSYLLHILGDGVLLEELCALACVEALRVCQELTLKVLLVDGQRGTFGEGVLLVQAQLD